MHQPLATRRLLAATVLAGCAAGAAAVPASIDLSTGPAWSIAYNDIEAQVGRSGPAFSDDCLGQPGGPRCLSVTSTGFADGTWLPGASEAGFTGPWTAFIDFMLPAGASHLRLSYELLAVDDFAALNLSFGGTGLFIAAGALGGALPAGTEDLSGLFGAPGPYRLTLDVQNNPGFVAGGFPRPLTLDDGTAVAGRFRISFDLPGGTVPEPGSLACAGLALGAGLAARRRARRRSA